MRARGSATGLRRMFPRISALLALIGPALLQAQTQDSRKALTTLGPEPLNSLQLSNYLLGIVIVFAMLALASWLLRRYQPQVGRGLIRIQSCLSLGGKEKLMVVEVQGRRLLIGVSSAGISLLQDLRDGAGDAAEAGTEASPPVPPGSWLQQTLKSVMGS